jgi:radial spoke head protein 1
MNGHGVYHYKSGNIYEGNLKEGIRFGYGKMKFANGETYEGNWKNNKKDGQFDGN